MLLWWLTCWGGWHVEVGGGGGCIEDGDGGDDNGSGGGGGGEYILSSFQTPKLNHMTQYCHVEMNSTLYSPPQPLSRLHIVHGV